MNWLFKINFTYLFWDYYDIYIQFWNRVFLKFKSFIFYKNRRRIKFLFHYVIGYSLYSYWQLKPILMDQFNSFQSSLSQRWVCLKFNFWLYPMLCFQKNISSLFPSYQFQNKLEKWKQLNIGSLFYIVQKHSNLFYTQTQHSTPTGSI